MSKLDDNVNEILGLDPSDNEKSMVTTESFKPPVERKEGEKYVRLNYTMKYKGKILKDKQTKLSWRKEKITSMLSASPSTTEATDPILLLIHE